MSNETELEIYASMEGTEIGDYCCALVSMRCMGQSYGMSDTFNKALDEEIKYQLNMFKTMTKIVKRTETQTISHDVEELEWLDD